MSFLLILLFGFYTFGATEDKQSFFRMLFLGENIDQIYPLILMLIFFSVVLFAQKNIYKKFVPKQPSEINYKVFK